MNEGAQVPRPGADQAFIKYGLHNEPGPHVGRTVGDVRQTAGRLIGIPPDTDAFVGKVKVGEDHVIAAGETIEFRKDLGEKG